MTKYLNVNDVLSALSASEHPRFDVHRNRLEHAVNLAAKDLASHFGLNFEKAETVLDFGGLCVAMRPVHDRQMWPKELAELDPGGSFD
ncbi:hypothetical protein [Roseovarius atlanticus]|uniref:hypothetical protein n=1 Tax=Roseovarius atlanticus TaxID=1641875 RepID=UPI000AC51E26|nr:hypothetical protein [Roseovarius atlanticus]